MAVRKLVARESIKTQKGLHIVKILIIDGQGGGVGKALVERLKAEFPDQPLIAVGTNVMATAAMLRAGADQGATGENAIAYNAKDADLILGPIGILAANAMLGELSPRMAEAIGASRALKILVPVGKCRVQVAGSTELMLGEALDDAMRLTRAKVQSK